MKKHIILAAAALAAAVLDSHAQGILSPRTANLLPGLARSESPMSRAYITVDTDIFDASALELSGCTVSMQCDSILSVRIPMDVLSGVAALPGVKYIQMESPAMQMLDIARVETGMEAVYNGTGLDMPYTGKGVVVGIVDSGFDYAHAAFRDKDGNLRIRRVWEQSAEASGGNVPYGAELRTSAEILAAAGDIRNNSHGTHVTGIAAGSDTYLDGALRGMAPEADIVLVSMTEAGVGNVAISDAISYIFAYADEVNKPCVVNLSLGSQNGPHDGTSTFDRLADAMQGPGRLIVGAAGNHRAGRFHIRKEFTATDNSVRTFVDFLAGVSERTTGGEIEFWCGNPTDLEVNVLVYKLSNGDVAETVKIYPTETEGSVTYPLGRNMSGSVRAASETSPLNGKAHISLITDVTSIRTGYALALEAKADQGAVLDMWADNYLVGLTDRGVAGFTAPSGESTISEIGGTAKLILTVGAYTTRSTFTRLGESGERTLDETVGDLGSFSGCGPTADGRVKPEVTAPGCYISAPVSHFDGSGTQVLSHYHNDGGTDNYYGFMQGTSMSSPMMTGIAAVWLGAWPEMTPEDLREVVAATSRSDAFTGDVPNNMWGHGKVDALAGLKECVKRASQGGVSGVTADCGAPFMVVSDGSDTVLVCLRDMTGVQVGVYDIAGRLILTDTREEVRAMQSIGLNTGSGPKIIVVNAENQRFSFKIFGN